MAITNGQVANADDIVKIAISNLEGINQNTILSENAAVTDKTYTFAATDTFSDSNGYNNTVDTTITNTTATFTTDNYAQHPGMSSANVIYIDIYASSVNTTTLTDAANSVYCFQIATGVWRVISYKNSVAEASNRLFTIMFRGLGNGATEPNGVAGLTSLRCSSSTYRSKKVMFLKSTNGSWGSTIQDKVSLSSTDTSYIIGRVYQVNAGGTAIIYSPFTSSLISASQSETNDFNTGTIRTISSCDGIDSRAVGSPGSGSPKPSETVESIFIFSSSLTPTVDVNSEIISSAFEIVSAAPTFYYNPLYVQTNSKTFSSNVKSILVNANKVLNGASTITVDVSSDGGSTWDVTAQSLDTVLSLDADDTDVVVKFTLNIDGTDSPELYGYSYQVWT